MSLASGFRGGGGTRVKAQITNDVAVNTANVSQNEELITEVAAVTVNLYETIDSTRRSLGLDILDVQTTLEGTVAASYHKNGSLISYSQVADAPDPARQTRSHATEEAARLRGIPARPWRRPGRSDRAPG